MTASPVNLRLRKQYKSLGSTKQDTYHILQANRRFQWREAPKKGLSQIKKHVAWRVGSQLCSDMEHLPLPVSDAYSDVDRSSQSARSSTADYAARPSTENRSRSRSRSPSTYRSRPCFAITPNRTQDPAGHCTAHSPPERGPRDVPI